MFARGPWAFSGCGELKLGGRDGYLCVLKLGSFMDSQCGCMAAADAALSNRQSAFYQFLKKMADAFQKQGPAPTGHAPPIFPGMWPMAY